MHESQYILRARGGTLTKMPVEKVLLPHDREANPQAIQCYLESQVLKLRFSSGFSLMHSM
jgi:hypothetical protein